MSDVKRLLEQASPLPWHSWRSRYVNGSADAVLAVYAVNRLPDYLAAVEALEAIYRDSRRVFDGVCRWCDAPPPAGDDLDHDVACPAGYSYAALDRLRDEVPA